MDLSQLYNDLDHIMMHCYDSATVLQISTLPAHYIYPGSLAGGDIRMKRTYNEIAYPIYIT